MYFSGTPLSHMHQYSSSLGTLSYAFSRSMNTQCKSCCPSLYLSCSCLSANTASVVDFPFTNPNCSSLMLTMFLSRLSCTDTLARCPDSFHSSDDVSFILEDGYQDAFSPYVWDLLLISDLVQCFLQKIHSSSSQTLLHFYR